MKDIRIGNDISVRWSLYKGDEAYDLTNLPVTLYLKNAYGKKEIKDYTIEGNQISWTFFGKDQKNTGKYSMVLVVREGEQGMASTDYCDFVQLVSCACQVSGVDDENIQTETIELTSEVDFPPIIVDTSLSEVSGNPIANMAVAKAFATQAESIKNKVDKVEGLGLSEENYTANEKAKLAGLENYDDTAIKGQLTELSAEVSGLSDIVFNPFTRKGEAFAESTNPPKYIAYTNGDSSEYILIPNRIKGKVYLSTSNPNFKISFLDADKKFVSNYQPSTTGLQDIDIKKSNLPANAHYMVVTTYIAYTSQCYLLCDYYSDMADLNTKVSELSEGIDTKFATLEDSILGDAFITKGYYVVSTTGAITTTSNPSAITDYIDISGVKKFKIKGRSGSVVALVAFYDADKKFISAIYGTQYSKVEVVVNEEQIPLSAKYMVATGVGDGTDFLQVTSLNDLYMRLQNMEKSTQPINLSAILTMGASLMYNGNGWVEDGCSIVGVTPYNKAASGVGVPSYFADLIWRNAYCTDEEFENADILAIQFASSTDMYIENNTKSIEDYESALDTSAANPFESISHAECLDYILKKWQKKCYEQKDNPNSKWYGTQYGKPCSLLFVTHWHDGRTNYNETIRQVAAKWGGCVCEFDKKIGFSKNQTLYDGRQPSVIYAVDTQVLDGVTYGWHPLRGDAGKKYIQRKMANIFADTIKECYSLYL